MSLPQELTDRPPGAYLVVIQTYESTLDGSTHYPSADEAIAAAITSATPVDPVTVPGNLATVRVIASDAGDDTPQYIAVVTFSTFKIRAFSATNYFKLFWRQRLVYSIGAEPPTTDSEDKDYTMNASSGAGGLSAKAGFCATDEHSDTWIESDERTVKIETAPAVPPIGQEMNAVINLDQFRYSQIAAYTMPPADGSANGFPAS